MKKSLRFLIAALMLFSVPFLAMKTAYAYAPNAQASVNGTYSNLLQVLKCPSDRATYGSFRDYGYWGGGPWCGKSGKAGYWVWVAPNWYVWENKGNAETTGATDPNIQLASVNGKYANLRQVMKCPADRATYGTFRDYGHWGGGAWCGQTGQAGYWVWVAPNWYVWEQSQ